MKSRVVLLSSLLLAMLIPLMVLGSSGCGRDTGEVWTRQFGSDGDDLAKAVIVDGSGNIYVAGYTTGTFPGQPSSGSSDAFVARYDSAGNEVWTRQFSTRGRTGVRAIVADGSGDIYLSAGGARIAKYDTSGNEVWTRQFGSTNDVVKAMAADGSGNIYVAGETMGTSSAQDRPGLPDAFIAKYDGLWNEAWRRQFVTTYEDGGVKAMVVDGSGSIYVAGNTLGGPGPDIFDDSDVYVAKYDTAGNEAWMRKLGPTLGLDQAAAVAADGSGGVYVAGNNVPTCVEDTLISGGGTFMARYDASGNEVWIKQPGTMGDLCANAVAVDGLANIYVAGDWIVKYDPSGNEVWTRHFGTRSGIGVRAMAADGSGNIWLAGSRWGTSTGSTWQANDYDAFIMKIRE